MRNFFRSSLQNQRGIVWWLVAIIIVVVVAAIAVTVAVVSSTTTTPISGSTAPGCIPAATQCRVFIQSEVSCCGGQQVVGQRIGWCVGWWDGIPCH